MKIDGEETVKTERSKKKERDRKKGNKKKRKRERRTQRKKERNEKKGRIKERKGKMKGRKTDGGSGETKTIIGRGKDTGRYRYTKHSSVLI